VEFAHVAGDQSEGTSLVINAVIYVPPENYGASAARCLDYCAVKRYNVVGLVPGDRRAALRMLSEGLAAVIVVASAEHLSPVGEPRIELVPKRFTLRRRASNVTPARRCKLGDPAPAASVRGS
jgi:hypothetical protein